MTLQEVLAGVALKQQLSDSLAAREIAGLDYDSRRIEPLWLFFAFPGAQTDGRQFATEAVEHGAVAVVSELPAPEDFHRSWIQVEHGRHALSAAARNFYGHPDRTIALTGVTGTNGKTTTSFLIDSVLRAAGKVTALVGTIEYHLGDSVLAAVNTTPESLDLCRLLDELRQLGGTHATMEVSSHALDLGRVYGFDFHTAVFTNLTQDHLDYHETMERYFDAKSLLFNGENGAEPPRFAIVNADDEYGRKLRTVKETQGISYGIGNDANLRAKHVSTTIQGLKFEAQFGKLRFDVESHLIGRINVYNILAAIGVGLSYQIPIETIVRGIGDCPGIPGRFERVDTGQPFAVVVDYSHTEDALRNALAVARGLNPNRIITVFGCGGDRDRRKRPLMGQAAAEGSDIVVLTSDNPRSEDPLLIMNDVLVGIRRKDKPVVVEPDRAAAIRYAIKSAAAGDLVLIAGKGHETYQIFRDRTIHFDDREVAREVLQGFGYKKVSA
jgi:UDP-N-acetylmuramoyl-L-alanyl-D-glutamate--2,6-diaminopimelate ligase